MKLPKQIAKYFQNDNTPEICDDDDDDDHDVNDVEDDDTFWATQTN